ncbi:hypothetical protein RSAG8_07564, partial [Rhizoctonia solani AG-8 WAC10335]
MLFTSLAVLIAGATSVRAHGYPQTVNIGGQTYQAWHPFTDPYAQPNPTTVVRKVPDDSPLTYNSPDLRCNKGGSVGNGVTATVAAGQSVTWAMNTWPADHKGPMQVYMANCGDSCDNFDGAGNVWFKVSSEGLLDPASFYWGSDKLVSQGNSWTQVIPSNIKAGKYLMRFELIALHSAGSPQFYPSCTQLDVTGGGDGAPTQSELFSIPGVYQQGDSGLFGSIWEQPQSWPQVGPNVAAFISGESAPAPAPSSTPTTPTSSDKPASTSKSSSTSKSAATFQVIPSNIKAGKYLMRFELIALHSAGSPQFYPSCTQLDVSGGGDGAPTQSELFSIPGVYQQGDSGLFGSIWEQPQSWPQVGPNVAAFISGESAPAPAPSTTPTTPTSSDKPASTSKSSSTSKSAATSTYSEPESYPSPTKGPGGPRPTPTTKSRVCRIKRAQKNHFAKREYMRRLGKKRL